MEKVNDNQDETLTARDLHNKLRQILTNSDEKFREVDFKGYTFDKYDVISLKDIIVSIESKVDSFAEESFGQHVDFYGTIFPRIRFKYFRVFRSGNAIKAMDFIDNHITAHIIFDGRFRGSREAELEVLRSVPDYVRLLKSENKPPKPKKSRISKIRESIRSVGGWWDFIMMLLGKQQKRVLAIGAMTCITTTVVLFMTLGTKLARWYAEAKRGSVKESKVRTSNVFTAVVTLVAASLNCISLSSSAKTVKAYIEAIRRQFRSPFIMVKVVSGIGIIASLFSNFSITKINEKWRLWRRSNVVLVDDIDIDALPEELRESWLEGTMATEMTLKQGLVAAIPDLYCEKDDVLCTDHPVFKLMKEGKPLSPIDTMDFPDVGLDLFFHEGILEEQFRERLDGRVYGNTMPSMARDVWITLDRDLRVFIVVFVATILLMLVVEIINLVIGEEEKELRNKKGSKRVTFKKESYIPKDITDDEEDDEMKAFENSWADMVEEEELRSYRNRPRRRKRVVQESATAKEAVLVNQVKQLKRNLNDLKKSNDKGKEVVHQDKKPSMPKNKAKKPVKEGKIVVDGVKQEPIPIEILQSTIAIIVNAGKKEEIVNGYGVAINNYIVSSSHVYLKGAIGRTSDGQDFALEIVTRDEEKDLILYKKPIKNLKGELLSIKSRKLSKRPARVNARVSLLNHASISPGNIVSTSDHTIGYTIPTEKGDSGSGVYEHSKGSPLLGLHTTGQDGVNYATSAIEIASFLASITQNSSSNSGVEV